MVAEGCIRLWQSRAAIGARTLGWPCPAPVMVADAWRTLYDARDHRGEKKV